jgi:hypothetical protein
LVNWDTGKLALKEEEYLEVGNMLFPKIIHNLKFKKIFQMLLNKKKILLENFSLKKIQ